MNNIVIHTIDKVVNRDIVKFIVHAWNYLIEHELTENGIMIDYDHGAIYATIDDKVVGVISYRHYEWCDMLHIFIGYVLPEYRRSGIYRQLFEKLKEVAKDKKCITIEGGTKPTNDTMLKVMESLDRRASSINTRYIV